MLDKDTQVCISVATKPSQFGTTVHNRAYQALGLNFIYKAFGVSNLKGAIDGVKALGIRGCSVTMPFKEQVLKYVDDLDKTAKSIGAVNTIVNNSGRLKGYNTDAYGAKVALETLGVKTNDRVLLLGAGGAAKAILFALKELGVKDIFISNRTLSKAQKIAQKNRIKAISWQERNKIDVDVLINATPIGMLPNVHEIPVELNMIQKVKMVMDVIVTPIESRLIQVAKKMGKKIIAGYEMSLHQAAAQFKIYTGQPAPLNVMRQAVLELLQGQR